MAETKTNGQEVELLYELDEVPPVGVTATMSLQILLLLVAPTTLTPLVVISAAGLDPAGASWVVFASLIASGITSFIQIHRVGKIGSGYLLFMGSSGAFLAVCVAAAEAGGWPLVATLSICSAPFQVLFARYLGWFRHIVTPMVGGVTITLIVVSVLPIAVGLMGGGNEDLEVVEDHFWLFSGTLLVILLTAFYLPARYRLCSPIFGLVLGLLLAWGLGVMDWSSLHEARWIGLPSSGWQGLDLRFSMDFWILLPSFILVTVVGAVETIADAMTVQPASSRNFRKVNYRKIQGSLYADGLGNALSGGMGTIPNTTYSNLVSLVELTGVASRRIGYWVCAGLMILAFSPKLAALLIAIPGPIVGAFLFFLLSILFVSGLRLIGSSGFPFESAVIVGVAFWFGHLFQEQDFYPQLIPEILQPFFSNGMVSGGVMALIFSWLYNIRPRRLIRFKMACEEQSLATLQAKLQEFARKSKLTAREAYNLELAGEELFMVLCRQVKEKKNVRVMVEVDSPEIHLEMIASGEEIEEVDLAAESYLGEPLSRISPDDIGIGLLGRIVSKLEQKTVGGVHYIRASLRRCPPSPGGLRRDRSDSL